MARDAVAIYIDDSAIRVLSVGGRRPRQWVLEPLEEGLVRDGLILDEAQVATRIRELWASKAPGSRRVIAGISGINCMYRFLTLPELPAEILPEAVAREASRAFGVPLDRLYTSWQALPGKPGETLVYVAAAARLTVDALIRTLRQANLDPYLMDIAPLALARATAEGNALVADLQSSSLDIVVKMDGVPEVIRSVPVSRKGSWTEKLNTVRQELQRAVTFYNSSHADHLISDEIPILLSGELGDHPESWKDLLGRAERRIEIMPMPLESPEGFSAHLYSTLVGLALKETAGKAATAYLRINFNALPQSLRPKPTPIGKLLYFPFLIAAIIALLAAGYMVMSTRGFTSALRETSAAKSELVVRLGAEISGKRQAAEKERDSLTAQVTASEAQAKVLDLHLRSHQTGNDEINGDLGEVHKTPAGIDLDSIDHSGSVVDVTGWGSTEKAVFDYARQLRSSGRFTEVVVIGTWVDGVQTGFSFALYK